ncbi:MAG: dockerin type I domain-containing protein, partial [Oscillospiraceae bacterium]|nr:dockerin type I domain-containing protein [Oscillospiraceae bacterium]
VGNYPQSAVDALGAAIAAAQSVADKSDSTQEQVDAAVTALQSATSAFAAAEILVPPPSDETVDVKVTVKWGAGTMPQPVTIELWARTAGTPATDVRMSSWSLNANNGWTHTFNNLQRTDAGNLITYYVKETGESGGIIVLNRANYSVSYSQDSQGNWTVTNSWIPDPPPTGENTLGVVRSDESSTQKGVFNVVANFPLTNVNLVEATVNFDASQYDVSAVSAVGNATVDKVDVVNNQGIILIGVANEATLGHNSAQVLATISLTPKSGLEPEKAYVELSNYIAYSIGEEVALTANPANAESAFTYVTIPTLDVNGDGAITAADLSLVLYYFGATEFPAGINADVNSDGIVDMIDVTLLVNALYA